MTTFKATVNRFTEMFTLLSMNKVGEALFNPIILKVVEENGETYIKMLAQDSANTCATSQKHRGFDILDVDKTDIIVNCNEVIEALKIFTPESEVTIEFGERILIKNTEQSDDYNEVSFPSLQLEENIKISDQIPFKIKNGMPVLKNKETGKLLKFDVEAKIPVKYIQSQIKSADFANISPRLFEMKFDDENFTLIIGNPDFYEKSVKKETKIESSGKANVVFGNGYEQIFSSLTGDVIVFTSTNSPTWITKKDKNYIVQFILAPAIVESE